jgi:hypothetical protein
MRHMQMFRFVFSIRTKKLGCVNAAALVGRRCSNFGLGVTSLAHGFAKLKLTISKVHLRLDTRDLCQQPPFLASLSFLQFAFALILIRTLSSPWLEHASESRVNLTSLTTAMHTWSQQ